MPHAALWVVQREIIMGKKMADVCFNAARGFVGGATKLLTRRYQAAPRSFNAARGFVGGAAKKPLNL